MISHKQLEAVGAATIIVGILAGCGTTNMSQSSQSQITTSAASPSSSNQTSKTVRDTVQNIPANNTATRSTLNSSMAKLKNTDSIHMTSQSVGWDFTQFQGKLSKNSVLHTDNGGRNWKNATPSELVNDKTIFAGGTSIDANHAWFVTISISSNYQSESVFRTSNGGETWSSTQLSSGYLLAWFSFINSQIGWLLSGQPATGQEPSVLYGTNNGGRTWTKVNSSDGDLPLDDGKTGISFANSDTGWITIDNGLHPGNVVLDVTHDGGHKWISQSIPVPSQMKHQYAHPIPPVFSSVTNGVLPVTFDGGKGTILYFTNDGGTSWTPSAPLPINKISNVTPVGNKIAWVADGDVLYATMNGGRKWIKVNQQITQNRVVVDIYPLADGMSAIVFMLQNGKVVQRQVNI